MNRLLHKFRDYKYFEHKSKTLYNNKLNKYEYYKENFKHNGKTHPKQRKP